ncbi:MAG: methyltransferase domain-containing protein [Acidobacteria bacterium]|nr:methyltransferase domain-containing protein [Acidobacteriota bacterium]
MTEPLNRDGAVAITTPPTESKSRLLQRFWERYFYFYDTLNESPPYRRMVERHAALLQPAAGDTILDAGSGTANVTAVLAVPGARVTGIDFCEPALERCRRKVPTAEFRVADLTRTLPFPDATFDKAACSLVLHYLVPERQRFAATELFRVLRPGGALAITVFAAGFNTWRVYAETLRERRRTDGIVGTAIAGVRYLINTSRIFYYVWRIKRAEQSGDYRFATAEELSSILAGAGFQVESVEPTMAGQCWTALAHKPAAPLR